MKKQFNKMAGILLCILFGFILLFIMNRIDYIWGAIVTLINVLTPFLYAFGLAYILNFPFRFFENKVFGKIKVKWVQKINRPISLTLTYVLFIGLLSFFTAILIPQLFENISKLVTSIPSYIKSFKEGTNALVNWLSERFSMNTSFFDGLKNNFTGFLKSLANLDNLSNVYSAALSTGVFVYNWVMAFIISIYMLASKEFLSRQIKRFCVAFLPTKWMPAIYDIIDVSDDKCGKFLVGKILDSTIIGVMVFICMTLLHLPFAPLISVIVAVCNIIPFFGPFLGGIPSGLLLFMVDPLYCLEFVVMIFILQQIDGNIIGPKVVGSKVGLIGFWSLFSVILAGGIFGLPGMILGTPIFAAIYTLIGRKTTKRIEMKGENAERVIKMNVIKSNDLINIKAKPIINAHIKSHLLKKDSNDETKETEENEE
ncbi:MAG: AI-2E family transporter [Ruminococcus sp.]|nr:AI-2E family transporter [Ruminococcus sp.]